MARRRQSALVTPYRSLLVDIEPGDDPLEKWVSISDPRGSGLPFDSIKLRFALQGSRAVCTGVEVTGDSLGVAAFRKLPLAQLIEDLGEVFVMHKDVRAAMPKAKVTPRRGPKGNPAAFYAGVADWYLEAQRVPPRQRVRRIADRKGVSLSTAYRWVKEAKRRGFIVEQRKEDQ